MFLALGADKASWAPLLVQRRDVVLRDGLVASSAARRVQLQEAVLGERGYVNDECDVHVTTMEKLPDEKYPAFGQDSIT